MSNTYAKSTIRTLHTLIRKSSIYLLHPIPYGSDMTQSLLISGFHLLQRNQIDAVDVHTLRDDNETGYILKVDIQNLLNLHELDSDYPLGLKKLSVTGNMYSPHSYRMKLLKHFSCSSNNKVRKPDTSIDGRGSYVIRYRTLKFYLKLRMQLETLIAFYSSTNTPV